MKRITISIPDDTLKKIRKAQSEIQANEALNVSVSSVIGICSDVALAKNRTEVKNLVHANLDRPDE